MNCVRTSIMVCDHEEYFKYQFILLDICILVRQLINQSAYHGRTGRNEAKFGDKSPYIHPPGVEARGESKHCDVKLSSRSATISRAPTRSENTAKRAEMSW